MTRVFVRHKVKNYARWREVFDSYRKVRRAGGEKSFKVGNIAGSPNNVVILFSWDSVANAKAFFRSKELKAAMAEAGVREKPEVYIFEDK
ncbi:MAG: cyclase [Verrucomicrobia bacterium]|nr:MAG: cyclase [Verrucomicrobiota bacterium]